MAAIYFRKQKRDRRSQSRSRPTDATHNQCACYALGFLIREAREARSGSSVNDRGRLVLPPLEPALAARPALTEKARFSAGTDLPPSVAISLRLSNTRAM